MADIGSWLVQHGLGNHETLFVEHDIDLLPLFTEQEIDALAAPGQ